MQRRLPFIGLVLVLSVYAAGYGQSRLVRAGAHNLNMSIQGSGSTTVVFESGFGGTIRSWDKVVPEVSRFAHIVAYDRAGLGQSERGPTPRTANRIANELHAALKNAGVRPPYVLVGHSAGGAYVRVFAHLYPKEVAGLLLIEPPQEELLLWLKTHDPEKDQMPPQRLAQLPVGMQDEWAGRDTAVSEMQAAWPLPKVPGILLTSNASDEGLAKEVSPEALKVLLNARAQWLRRVPQMRHMISEKSGHDVPNDEPGLVIDAIKQLLAESKRAGR